MSELDVARFHNFFLCSFFLPSPKMLQGERAVKSDPSLWLLSILWEVRGFHGKSARGSRGKTFMLLSIAGSRNFIYFLHHPNIMWRDEL